LNDEQFEIKKQVIATAMASLAAADSDEARGLQ
jgi:hypothetical protein